MSCTRCGGTVVIEEFLDDKGSSLGFEGLRCLNCGHIEDSVIHSNRGGVPFHGRRGMTIF